MDQNPQQNVPEGVPPVEVEPETPPEETTTVSKRPRRPINVGYVVLGLFGGLVVILLFGILVMQTKLATEKQVNGVWREAVAGRIAAQTAAANTENVGARLGSIEQSVVVTDPNGKTIGVGKALANHHQLVMSELDENADNPIVRKSALDTRMKDTEKLMAKRTSKKYLLSVMSKVPAPRVDQIERDVWDLMVEQGIHGYRLDDHSQSLRKLLRK